MIIHVYAIQSQVKPYIYIGLTNNLKRRISEHNKGKERTTKSYIPFQLIYFEVVEGRIAARKIEKHLKTSGGRHYLKNLPSKINNYQIE